MHEVWLSMLDTSFRVATNDERIAGLIVLFWEPFLIPGPVGDVTELAVDNVAGHWTISFDSRLESRVLDPWVLVVTIRNLLTNRAIHSAPDVIPLHSSVVERDGIFLVLAGPGRAGKTTLLLELLRRGWLYVSDDLAPIDLPTATAAPFPKPLQVRDPALLADFAAGWTVPDWLPAPGSVSLVPPTVLARTGATAYRPTVVVFPRYEAGTEPVLEPLSAALALIAAGENLQREGAVLGGGVTSLRRWIGSAPAARIRYESTRDALELLGRALTGVTPDPP